MVATITAPDGIDLALFDEGEGPPVVLLHGLFASAQINWEWTGIGPRLRAAGFRTIAPDARGHGGSGKPLNPIAYGDDRFAADVSAVLDHLQLDRCALLGYSMGGLVALRTVPVEPRITAAVLGGIGVGDMLIADRELIADALEAEDPGSITDPIGREYREFADATGADRTALAAAQRGRWGHPFELARVDVPALVLTGEDDHLAGDPYELAIQLPQGEAATVPGDHASALLAPTFTEQAIAFLAEHT